ncbi:MAG TPA: prepilin-type N-terminal cleavage/methylation domain-containing protein [Acidimicrobiales bacterium]|jgi:prepilin-type N-terminal cleavage/methylation domain-containing protein
MRHHDDAGVTLMELLVCIAIMSIVSVALASAFVAANKSITKSGYLMDDSHDGQIAASYFTTDVESADSISTAAYPSCSAGTPLISFTWHGWDQSHNPPVEIQKVAVYRVVEPVNPGDERQLVRQYCEGVNSSSVTPVSSTVIAHNLKPGGGAADPAVTCFSAVPVSVTCDSSIASAQLVGTARSQMSDDNVFFTYTVRATRRLP